MINYPSFYRFDNQAINLAGIYNGCTAFLICGGPSLKKLDLSLLNQRGVLTLGINNVAAKTVKCNMWVGGDSASKFCHNIFLDPTVRKFISHDSMDSKLRVRDSSNNLIESNLRVRGTPNIFGYVKNQYFNPDSWLSENTFNWGNGKNIIGRDGIGGKRSTMLVALKILFVLGVRVVNIIGADFYMPVEGAKYAFEQEKDRTSVAYNNELFAALNVRFSMLQPKFLEQGFEVYNCTPNSRLTAFPVRSFVQSIAQSIGDLPKEIITKGMYETTFHPSPATKYTPKLREIRSGSRSRKLPKHTTVMKEI